MIGIIDLEMGNIKSVSRALDFLHCENFISSDPIDLQKADKLILPGVGNFSVASQKLFDTELGRMIRRKVLSEQTPILGICLGMQLLFTTGYEDGENPGLDFLPGEIRQLKLSNPCLRVPHMGWNDLQIKPSVLFKEVKEGECVYFVHSYAAQTDEKYITAKTNYGDDIVAAVENENVYGTQFHPEKSQTVGIQILRNFIQC